MATKPTQVSTPPGTGAWRFMERVDIADVSAPTDVYLRRWYLLETPWFGLKLHHILRPDADRALHDHPWSFVSLILRGGYTEEVADMHSTLRWMPGAWVKRRLTHRAGALNVKRADELHRIDVLHGECWTLVVSGRKSRTWGFSDEPGHWQRWNEYLGLDA